MNRLDEVRARRAALVQRCEEERTEIATAVVALERPMSIAGRAIRIVAFLRANPLIVVGPLALLMLVPRRRRRAPVPAPRDGAMPWVKRFALLDILRRGFILWRSVRRIQRVSSFIARVVR